MQKWMIWLLLFITSWAFSAIFAYFTFISKQALAFLPLAITDVTWLVCIYKLVQIKIQ